MSILTVAAINLVLCGSASVLGQSADSGPKLIGSATYSMPASAIEAEIGGDVTMAIRVESDGKPSRAVLISGPTWPCGKQPNDALRELSSTLSDTMMSLKFIPASKDGKPIEREIGLRIALKNPKLLGLPSPSIDPVTGKPKIKQISGGVLNGKAILLEKPFYPAEARKNRDGGTVSVQVMIDEDGNVVRAGAVNGAPTLQWVSRDAACRSKFSRTTLKGEPVKVFGVITYNFIP
ncbi:MAG: energy transducer TonB [Acidobacteria bacterium]|nr:energy transducer TonB [Acidobacteriota bacterium]